MTKARGMLITGAGSGIGRGLAEHFGRAGTRIVAADIDGQAAAETAERIIGAGGRASAVQFDVAREGEVARAIAGLSEPPIDVLLNNAGLQHVASLEEFPPEKWGQLIDIMLKGAAWTTRAVLPGMKQRGFGRIINIGSIHSLVASAYKSAYVAAKHGLLGFARVIALETADKDITINTICPSYVRTPLVEKQIAAQARAHGISESQVVEQIMLKPMPKKAFITIEELAAAVEYLISDGARNITGQTIVIDGGWTAQ